jgi:acetyltransferase-like isoleucine patch superfamily enzyme
LPLRHYAAEELAALLGSAGTNVLIDRAAILIEPRNIHVGSNVRIDALCILSAGAGIRIGSRVHLGAATHLFANEAEIVIGDFCGISSRVSFFSSTDDYSSGHMTNPMVPDECRNVRSARITADRHAIVGSGSVVMPGVTLGLGASVGALSYVNKSVPPLAVVSGNPARLVGQRDGERLMALEKKLAREPDA